MSERNTGSIERGTDAWNVAQGYTHLKILKPLVEMDKLIKVSLYGYENIEEDQFDETFKTRKRIEAINRLIDVLRETIENSYFAMSKEDKKLMEEYERQVLEVQKVIQAVSFKRQDQRNGTFTELINEEHFSVCLEKLRKIKKNITTPLNNSALIFPTSDEIDLNSLKDQLIFGG